MTRALNLAPIRARLAALEAEPTRDVLERLSRLAQDVPALLAEIERLRAEHASEKLDAVAGALNEAARQVRETASMDMTGRSAPPESSVVRTVRLDALADRLDAQAADLKATAGASS